MILKAFPDEINHIWGRIRTAGIATDPMGVELTDVFISLKRRDKWTKATTQAELTDLIQKEIRRSSALASRSRSQSSCAWTK